jgi:ABC-type nitrate/sulfonate/bicarbonate transport system permease component
VPLPSLSPGETITWVRAERPTLDLVGVFLSSFWIVLIATIVALSTGVLLGVLRYRRRAATGFVRLPLRDSPGDTEHR